MNNVLTVDGEQVAILNVKGVILKHHVNQYKREFAEQFKISPYGMGYIVTNLPRKCLKYWTPRK